MSFDKDQKEIPQRGKRLLRRALGVVKPKVLKEPTVEEEE